MKAAGTVAREVAGLDGLTVGQLKRKYAEVFGEEARSGNRQWLLRRVAWRVQMLAEGEIAERTMAQVRERAKELARDADLRVRPPLAVSTSGVAARTVVGGAMTGRDGRVPPPGTVLRKTYRQREHLVTVLDDGFEYEGQVYRSLSAVAHAMTGSHWNGFLFFGLASGRGGEGRGGKNT